MQIPFRWLSVSFLFLYFRWSPSTLPRCEVEYHPKMAWLSKRSVATAGGKVIRIPKRAKRSLRRRQRSSSGSSNFYGNQKVATTLPNSKLWCHASKNDLQSKCMHPNFPWVMLLYKGWKKKKSCLATTPKCAGPLLFYLAVGKSCPFGRE